MAVKPKKVRKLSYGGVGFMTLVNQQFVGPGVTPANSANFAAGGPVTPYDLGTPNGTPLESGFGMNSALALDFNYDFTKFDATVKVGYGTVKGSANTIGYTGEQPLPILNAHLGQRGAPLPVQFTTHNNQDSTGNTRGTLEALTIVSKNKAVNVRAGWIDLLQGDRFAFAAPLQINSPQYLGIVLPQTLGDTGPAHEGYDVLSSTYPIHGYAATVRSGVVSSEIASADLPAPPGSPARARSASVVLDAKNLPRLSVTYVQATAAGDPYRLNTLFGALPSAAASNFGVVSQSTLFGQHQAIVGVRAGNINFAHSVADIELGTSRYSADGIGKSGSVGGNYYHLHGARAIGVLETSADFYRFESRYAPMLLAYGTFENVWSTPYAFPVGSPPGTYQLVDTRTIAPNRQGVRLGAKLVEHRVDARVSVATFGQIDANTFANARSLGFTERYFSPQLTPEGGTLGSQQQYAAWIDYQPPFARITLDLANNSLHRNGSFLHPEEAINVNYPQAGLSLSKPVGPFTVVALGAARYAVAGSYDSLQLGPNAVLTQSVIHAGFEYGKKPTSIYHVQYRLYNTNGVQPVPGGLAPAFHGSQIVIEQRFSL